MGDLSLSGRAILRNEALHSTEERRRREEELRNWEEEIWDNYCQAVDDFNDEQAAAAEKARNEEDPRYPSAPQSTQRDTSVVDPERNPYDGHGDRGAPCGDPTRPTSSLDMNTMKWTFYEYDEFGNRTVSRVENPRHTPEEHRHPERCCCPACGYVF